MIVLDYMKPERTARKCFRRDKWVEQGLLDYYVKRVVYGILRDGTRNTVRRVA